MRTNVVQIADGVHLVHGSHTNFVILEEDGAVTLVDTGYPGDRGLLESALRATGHSLADVEAVVLTHGHVDHLGSAEWLRRQHGVPVQAHSSEHPNARGEVSEVISELELFKRIWQPNVFRFTLNAVRNGALSFEHVSDLQALSEGQPADLPGNPVPIHTPGHTSGHVGLHLPDRGALLSGDALITVDVWNHADTGPQLIRPQFNTDHSQAAASLGALAELDAEVVIPGHGDPYHGSPAEAVEVALARHHGGP